MRRNFHCEIGFGWFIEDKIYRFMFLLATVRSQSSGEYRIEVHQPFFGWCTKVNYGPDLVIDWS